MAPPGFTLSNELSTLRQSVIRQYREYHEKDRLLVICLDNSPVCPAHLTAFIGPGERPVVVSYVLNCGRRKGKPAASTAVETDGPDLEELTSEEVEAIVCMQRRWRRILKTHDHRRKLMATTAGQLHHQLAALCHERFTNSPGSVWISPAGITNYPDSASIPPEDRARIRKLVLIDGIDIMANLTTISISIRQLKEEWKVRIDDPLVAAEDIEELDNLHGQIGSIEAKLHDVSETWSLKGLAASIDRASSKTLSQQARQAQRQIVTARQEIEVIRSHIRNVGSRETS